MKWRSLTLAVAALLAAVPLPAQQQAFERLAGGTISQAQIDETVKKLMAAAEVPGLGLALFDHGKISYLTAYGVRDKAKNLPLTVDSIMSGASFTKVAFGYLVLQLADQRVLDLDKPIYEYLPKPLPEYPKYADLAGDLRYQRITARMLLAHTSGFPNWRWFEDDKKLKIHFAPGSRFAYSGEGINLLQLVVETVTGQPLEKLMQEHIFQPFGMTRSSMVWHGSFEENHADGYDEYERSMGPQRREQADAAGSLLTTPHDFALFVQAVIAGQGLSKHTRAEMLAPQISILSKHEFPTFADATTEENKPIRLSYGLAWGLYWTPYGEAFFKEGHDDGWRNYVVCFDKSGKGLLIMTNSSNGEGLYESLLENLLGNTFTPIEWESFTPYEQLPPRPPLKQHTQVHVDPQVLQKYLGRYGNRPSRVLVVRQEGDHLSIQENDEPKEEVFPESATAFFTKATDEVYSFEMDDQGRVTQMVLHVAGEDIPIKRIDQK